jgi:hypothetical protein
VTLQWTTAFYCLLCQGLFLPIALIKKEYRRFSRYKRLLVKKYSEVHLNKIFINETLKSLRSSSAAQGKEKVKETKCRGEIEAHIQFILAFHISRLG